jgi:hypothetical protein
MKQKVAAATMTNLQSASLFMTGCYSGAGSTTNRAGGRFGLKNRLKAEE